MVSTHYERIMGCNAFHFVSVPRIIGKNLSTVIPRPSHEEGNATKCRPGLAIQRFSPPQRITPSALFRFKAKKEGSDLLPPFIEKLLDANQFTFMAICRGFTSSALGTWISNIPSRYVAWIPSCFTVCGRKKERTNFPATRSTL